MADPDVHYGLLKWVRRLRYIHQLVLCTMHRSCLILLYATSSLIASFWTIANKVSVAVVVQVPIGHSSG